MNKVKPGGLLEKVINRKPKGNICETCQHLTKIDDRTLGCAAHDKLIIPEYLPYTGNAACEDWSGGDEQNQNRMG